MSVRAPEPPYASPRWLAPSYSGRRELASWVVGWGVAGTAAAGVGSGAVGPWALAFAVAGGALALVGALRFLRRARWLAAVYDGRAEGWRVVPLARATTRDVAPLSGEAWWRPISDHALVYEPALGTDVYREGAGATVVARVPASPATIVQTAKVSVAMQVYPLLVTVIAWGVPAADGTRPVVATEVAAGNGFSCAVMRDGTARCWGRNWFGNLGDGTKENRNAPVVVRGLRDASGLAAGAGHACAIVEGTVRCWGWNTAGQLGDGTTTDRATPVTVAGLRDVVQLAAGFTHTCAVRRGGAVWCWGGNQSAPLGDGTTVDRHAPTRVYGLTDVAQVAAGAWHTCARREDGTVWCWGQGDRGRLGQEGTIAEESCGGAPYHCRRRPQGVEGLDRVVGIAAGVAHTCARRNDGRVWCWGWNVAGEVGDGTTRTAYRPTEVAVAGRAVVAGSFQSCVVRWDGAVACWGRSAVRRWHADDTGDAEDVLRPRELPMLRGTRALARGDFHACALRAGGEVWCVGRNAEGQLGDGTGEHATTPVRVAFGRR